MPTILVSTVDDDGNTTLGAYSLCFPYYIAGKDYYAMILECRNSSNTAQNLLKRGKCALNFLEDSHADFKQTVKLGFPGQTSKEKMKNVNFEFEKGLAEGENRPLVLKKPIKYLNVHGTTLWKMPIKTKQKLVNSMELKDHIETSMVSLQNLAATLFLK